MAAGLRRELAYAARYGHQQVDAMMKWPRSQLRRFVEDLSDLVRAESDTSSRGED